MIKAVIFDWGGVIAPNARDGWLNMLATMLDITIEELLPHWRAAGYVNFLAGTIDEPAFWLELEKSLGRSLPADKSQIWLKGSALRPWPELTTFIRELREKNIVTAVLSNTVKPMSATARKMGLYAGFDAVVLSDEVGLAKPDPAIYELILNQLQLSADECIYIDDLPRNLIPAVRMGMTTVLASDNPTKTVSDIKSILGKNK